METAWMLNCYPLTVDNDDCERRVLIDKKTGQLIPSNIS